MAAMQSVRHNFAAILWQSSMIGNLRGDDMRTIDKRYYWPISAAQADKLNRHVWPKPIDTSSIEDLLIDAQWDAIEVLEYCLKHGYGKEDSYE